MKFFNIITVLTFSTLMVSQAQAIELVKVEPVVKFTITKAAQKNVSESIKLTTSNTISAKFVLDAHVAQLNNLKQKNRQYITKALLVAE